MKNIQTKKKHLRGPRAPKKRDCPPREGASATTGMAHWNNNPQTPPVSREGRGREEMGREKPGLLEVNYPNG